MSLRWLGTLVGTILVILLLLLGPGLARRDAFDYEWAGSFGTGVLQEPIGLAVAAGRVYVSDAGRGAIVVFDTSGRQVVEWGGDRLGMARPMHVSMGADELLYVADYLGDRVVALDTLGDIARQVGVKSGSGTGELDAPAGAFPLGDTVLVADFYNHRVQAFTPADARPIGRPGRVLPGRLHYPTDVAVGDSFIYIADAYNHRVQVFRRDGSHLRSWGGPFGSGLPGPLRGWFRVAIGVEVSSGRVYVADFHNHRIQVFTDEGKYLAQIGDSLRLPTDVAVADGGAVFVADYGHGRIARFRRNEE